jgi:hypothetical protein
MFTPKAVHIVVIERFMWYSQTLSVYPGVTDPKAKFCWCLTKGNVVPGAWSGADLQPPPPAGAAGGRTLSSRPPSLCPPELPQCPLHAYRSVFVR